MFPDRRSGSHQSAAVFPVLDVPGFGDCHIDDLVKALKAGKVLLAMGNSGVPVGQYTQKIFTYYGLDEAGLAAHLTCGSNIKEVKYVHSSPKAAKENLESVLPALAHGVAMMQGEKE